MPLHNSRVFLSVNGTEFKNKFLRDICAQFSIKQASITAHYPASHGAVERNNKKKKILEVLRHLAGRLKTCEDWLSLVVAFINDSVNPFTGKTPNYVLHGFEKRLLYDVLVHSPVPVYSLDGYYKLQLHWFHTIRWSIREKLKASRVEMLHKQLARIAFFKIQVGDCNEKITDMSFP